MSARLKRNWEMLKLLLSVKPGQRKAILLNSTDDLLLAICEIVDNVLRGTVKLNANQRKKLHQYKKVMRDMASKTISKKRKKELVAQKGGFLPIILAPALGLLASLVGELIGSAIKK